MRWLTVLHFYATGPGQELHHWLAQNSAISTTLCEHPFPFSHRSYARVHTCAYGADMPEKRHRRRAYPMPLRYLCDFFRTLRLGLHGPRYDVYVGNGAFDTLPGLILRILGRVSVVILYTIDYAPHAGGSKIYARLYRVIDRICCRYASRIWVLSPAMMTARYADGLRKDTCAPVSVVPHGTHAVTHVPDDPAETRRFRTVFMGHINEKSGIQLFLDALPALRAEFPRISLDVYGDGPYRATLEERVSAENVADIVRFHGYIADHDILEKYMCNAGVGIALYVPSPEDFTQFADPGKPKVYMACGLPVIMTDVPACAATISTHSAGCIIPYEKEACITAFRRIISDYDAYAAQAKTLAGAYEWPHLFQTAVQESGITLPHLPPHTA